MTRRLLISYLSVITLALVLLEIPLAIFYSQRERERIVADLEHDAYVLATLYEDDLEEGRPLDATRVEDYRATTDARIVVVDRAGISELDTEGTIDRDFSTRPEFASALAGATASGTRRSESLRSGLVFVAVPVASGGTVHGAVRVSLGTGRVDARIHRFWLGLVALAAIVLAVVGLVSWAMARSVSAPLRRLSETAARFSRGDLRSSDQPERGPPEMRKLARTLDTMASRLDELLRAQRRFVADASHQLRTPLTALRLRLENLQSRAPDGATASELSATIDEVTRLAALVADLLQLARADEHHELVVVDLAQLTADRVDTWTAVAEAVGARIDLRLPDGPAPVRAVPGGVEQILDNLLDNALTASPPGGRVHVEVSRDGARCRLSIEDEGPGLNDEQKAMATQRFWRASPSGAGTGLGLAIVDSLAHAGGGALRLFDAPAGGLEVVVDLPSAEHDEVGVARR